MVNSFDGDCINWYNSDGGNKRNWNWQTHRRRKSLNTRTSLVGATARKVCAPNATGFFIAFRWALRKQATIGTAFLCTSAPFTFVPVNGTAAHRLAFYLIALAFPFVFALIGYSTPITFLCKVAFQTNAFCFIAEKRASAFRIAVSVETFWDRTAVAVSSQVASVQVLHVVEEWWRDSRQKIFRKIPMSVKKNNILFINNQLNFFF